VPIENKPRIESLKVHNQNSFHKENKIKAVVAQKIK